MSAGYNAFPGRLRWENYMEEEMGKATGMGLVMRMAMRNAHGDWDKDRNGDGSDPSSHRETFTKSNFFWSLLFPPQGVTPAGGTPMKHAESQGTALRVTVPCCSLGCSRVSKATRSARQGQAPCGVPPGGMLCCAGQKVPHPPGSKPRPLPSPKPSWAVGTPQGFWPQLFSMQDRPGLPPGMEKCPERPVPAGQAS